MTVSFRLRYKRLGGHIHVRLFSSEFGPETTHGLNGTLVFRESEWPMFRSLLVMGDAYAVGTYGDHAPAVVQFADETEPEWSDVPEDGHRYECCGKVGRISRHEAWCPTTKEATT